MSWDEEQRKKLFEDYDVGKISMETLNEKIAILDKLANNTKKREMNKNSKYLIVVLSIILVLSVGGVSAYFIFRNTPEKEAQRILETMGAVGMMLASATDSANDSAKASTLIADLRNARAAGTVWFADNLGEMDESLASLWTVTADRRKDFGRYMDNIAKAAQLEFAVAVSTSGAAQYYVGIPGADSAVLNKAYVQGKNILFFGANVEARSPVEGDIIWVRVK